MIANRVASLRDLPHEVWIPLCSLANHEEGSVCLMSFQYVEKARRKFIMRSVVKRESNNGVMC